MNNAMFRVVMTVVCVTCEKINMNGKKGILVQNIELLFPYKYFRREEILIENGRIVYELPASRYLCCNGDKILLDNFTDNFKCIAKRINDELAKDNEVDSWVEDSTQFPEIDEVGVGILPFE